jgi:very-short-patch-repair endonuclease
MTKRVRALRRDATAAERVLWRGLRHGQLGWRFRRQHAIPPYIVDFACPEARLVVEVTADNMHCPESTQFVTRRCAARVGAFSAFGTTTFSRTKREFCEPLPPRWDPRPS